MFFESESDKSILAELGGRVRQLRLRKNLTQQQLAERTLLSLNTIKSLEVGRAKLATLVAVLRELGELSSLEVFLPDPGISPMQLAKRKGKVRQRATGSRGGGFGDDGGSNSGHSGDVEW
ncbi:helix-turn-helix transcriptional regulator [bacterium SCSIO 12696]|nr:helix-turn-helix transcriptional regulator [bacterium SCSIO 12696]